MNTIISLETAKQLKEWGCDIPDNLHYFRLETSDENKLFELTNFESPYNLMQHENYVFYKAYDLKNIICNKEMAIAFFGDDTVEIQRLTKLVEASNIYEEFYYDIANDYDNPLNDFKYLLDDLKFRLTDRCLQLLRFLQENEIKKAEQYLLDNCIFNPKNKK